MSRLVSASLAILAGLVSPVQAGSPYDNLARDLSRAAEKAGIRWVQVLPLVSADGKTTTEGRMLAGKILSAIVREGSLVPVEGHLAGALGESYREAYGVSRKQLRSAPGAQAVLMGSHVTLGARIQFNIQLLDAKKGHVIFADDAEVKNEWTMPWSVVSEDEPKVFRASIEPSDPLERAILEPEGVGSRAKPAPASSRKKAKEGGVPWFDDAADPDGCRDARRRADQMMRSILPLKARYTALRLKESGLSLTQHSDVGIDDPALRSQFDIAVSQHLDNPRAPPLSEEETRSLVMVDSKAFNLRRECDVAVAVRNRKGK